MVLKLSQNTLENTCAGVSLIIMLWAVASVPCKEYIEDKILTHIPAFLSSDSYLLFCFFFFLQRSDLEFEILYCILLLCCYQKHFQNPDKDLRWSFLWKYLMAWSCKKLQLRYLAGFWILLWMVYYSQDFSERLVIY